MATATTTRRDGTAGRAGLLALVAACSLVACGGGGGDDVAPAPIPDGDTLVGTFVPDQPNPDELDVTLRQESTNANFVTLQVNVTSVEDVYSAGFDLTFDPADVEFVAWTPGTLFELEGNTPLYTVGVTSGRLTVGATRSGGVEGVLVFASRTVIKLTFAMLREGNARLDFQNAFLLDSEPPAPSGIEGVEWHGGRFDIALGGD